MNNFLMAIKFKYMSKSRLFKYNKFIKDFKISSGNSILDVGISDVEYSQHDNFLEKTHPWPHQITALSIEKVNFFKKKYPEVKVVEYSGGKFPFRNNEFDISHSNAVIEHVGNFDKQVEFVKELVRVSNKVFFTTPSKWFPIEIHSHVFLLHYLPKVIFDKILCSIGMKWVSGGYLNLLSKKKLEKVIKEAGITNFQIYTTWFLFFPNHYIVTIEK